VLRRTRAITPMDAVRSRFGPAAEQVKVYTSTFISFFFAGFFLLGFATFASALLPIPLWAIVAIMGLIVVFYSVAGGSWSVQITDSLQALILIPVTIAFAVLCLHAVGGLDGLLEGIRTAGLSKDFAWIKEMDHAYTTDLPVRRGNFTLGWIFASVLGAITGAVNINVSYRYLSLTDEKSARKSALLAGCLMLLGCFIWFIPPMVGRLLFAEDIESVPGIQNPADAAYAITAMKLLPSGMVGLIFVCMLAATMSSMDSFLTGTAGFVVRNLYQPLRRGLGYGDPSDSAVLRTTRFVNLGLGLWAIAMAFILKKIGGSSGMFEVLQVLVTLIGAPISLPFALALIVRRIPLWGLFAGMVCGFLTSLTFFYLREVQETSYTWTVESVVMTIACIAPTLISMLFWQRASPAFKQRVDEFFVLIKTPINVSQEVGETMDAQLLKMVGQTTIGIAVAISPIAFFTHDRAELMVILSVVVFLLLLGGPMTWYGRKQNAATDRTVSR